MPVIGTSLNLQEPEDSLGAEGDYVDFPGSTSPIPVHNHVSRSFQRLGRDFLSSHAQLSIVQVSRLRGIRPRGPKRGATGFTTATSVRSGTGFMTGFNGIRVAHGLSFARSTPPTKPENLYLWKTDLSTTPKTAKIRQSTQVNELWLAKLGVKQPPTS